MRRNELHVWRGNIAGSRRVASMPRSRNIKPGFFTNEVLGEQPPLARLLFAGLWTLCDRDGRCEDRPKKIKAEVLPYDDCDVDALLARLQAAGFIARYVADGQRVIQVLAWDKHQNPHVKEAASTLPARDEHGASTVQAPDSTPPLPERTRLIPDSLLLIPDSGFLGEDGTRGAPLRAAPPPPPAFDGNNGEALNGRAVVPIADRFELPEAWGIDAEALGWKASEVLKEAEKFRQYWAAGKGKGTRRSVKGWRQSWSNWMAKAEKEQHR